MNIPEKLNTILGGACKLGYLPDKPDKVTAIFEYDAPPIQSFGRTDITHNIQLRCRDKTAPGALAMAESMAAKLNRNSTNGINIIQTSPVLDIGEDNSNPPRREATVNFTVWEVK